MTRQILFVQGAGKGTHDEWDNKLVQSLERELGDGYSIRYPRMPDEDDPQYPAWKGALVSEIGALADGAILIGHSVGGTMLIHTLAEGPPRIAPSAVLLLAAPFVGEGGWPDDDVNRLPDLAGNLPAGFPVLLYHGTTDDIVPAAHMQLYAAAIPRARPCSIAGRDHQFGDDLSEVARDILAFTI